MAGGSFGGSIKLTGESEYTRALKQITSNLTVMASEMKLVSSQFGSTDKSVQAVTSRNQVLNKQIEEGNKKINTYRTALADFEKQQTDNKKTIDTLKSSLEEETKKLNEMEKSTTASSSEIAEQKQKVADLSNELAKSEAQYDKNNQVINKYKTQLNLSEAEVNKLSTELDKNKSELADNRSAYQKLSDTIDDQKNRLSELKTKYGSVVLEQGKNSKEAKALASEIKTLSSDIKDNENKLQSSTKAIDKFSDSEKEAGTQTLKLGDIIKANLSSEAIIAGVRGLANVMKTVAGGIVDLGKEAIKSYADYEQLVGGVETLFKDSAKEVQQYASNAYKTAGLSANEYMETVTSFSASLIQSLGGDTQKAGEYANRAIIDMSDNANKMGTDMSMIQNAYQGFAKQNYTMLDNLKLGYGGTKTEMARLIEDASKMTDVQKKLGITVDSSSMSFGNIVNAISVMQNSMDISGYTTEELSGKLKNMSLTQEELKKVAKDMGISYDEATKKMKDGSLTVKDASILLGTTAREASITITGSLNAMKGAWQNLLTGIADDKADFGSLIDNFTESVMAFADNIVPRIEIALNGIVQMVISMSDTLIPKVLEIGIKLIENLVTGITSNIGSLMSSVNQIITTILNSLISMLPQILTAGIQVIVSLIQGIGQQLPTLIPQIIDAVLLMVETLLDNIDLIIDAGIQLIIGLAEGLILALPKLIDKIPVIIEKLLTAITNNLPKLIEMGIVLVVKLGVGLIKAIPNLVASVPKIIVALLNGIANYYSKLFSKGKELLGKVKDGIVSGISKIPEVGKNLVRGLWNGISNAKDWVLSKIRGFGQSILNGLKSFFGIHSPSTVFKDEIGSNLALGLGEGFASEMNNVSDMMNEAIPTDFDVGINTNYEGIETQNNSYSKDMLVSAFKEALDGMTFKAFDETFGELVIDKVEKVVYS